MKHRVLLVEDDDLLRGGLKAMIDLSDSFQVVQDVGSGKKALQAFFSSQPDLVLLDLMLPDTSGIDVLQTMKDSAPDTPVIIVTGRTEDDPIFSALECGADAYILKEAGAKELFLGMKYALAGDLFISPKIARNIVKDYIFVNRQRKAAPPLDNLTQREKEIVGLIAAGKKSKEIADGLFISVKTVSKHRSNILAKLGLKSCSALRGSPLLLDTATS